MGFAACAMCAALVYVIAVQLLHYGTPQCSREGLPTQGESELSTMKEGFTVAKDPDFTSYDCKQISNNFSSATSSSFLEAGYGNYGPRLAIDGKIVNGHSGFTW